jgi:hypothetical protein
VLLSPAFANAFPGRKYIVVEKEEKYIDIIKSRVEAAKQTLFTQD